MKKKNFVFIIAMMFGYLTLGQSNTQIALLKYSGGGDWYANPTSLTNLIGFCNADLGMNLNPQYAVVEVGSAEIFNYPFVHLTGHGKPYSPIFPSAYS